MLHRASDFQVFSERHKPMTKLKLEDNINMILNKENDRMSGECTWLRIGLDGGQL